MIVDSDSEFLELLSQAREGDSDKRGQLLELFRDYLRQLAIKSTRSTPDGQISTSDLVQSALIDADRDFANCKATTREELQAWLKQCLLNDIINRYRYLRRQKRDVRREKPLDKDAFAPKSMETPDEAAIRKEDESRLLAAMQKLTPQQRQIIELRHRDRVSFVEIGEQLGKSPDAVRMLWNRAVQALSKLMAED